jgi:MFS family permease
MKWTPGNAEGEPAVPVSRAVQGVGGAIMFSVSLALLAGAFRGNDRGVAFGAWGAITGIAVAVGPLLGGLLTSGISWRWIFFVNGPVGAVALVLSVLKVTGIDEAQLGGGDGSCTAGAGKPGSQTAGSRTARPTRRSPGAATRAYWGLSWVVVVPNVDARPAHITCTGMRGTGRGPG